MEREWNCCELVLENPSDLRVRRKHSSYIGKTPVRGPETCTSLYRRRNVRRNKIELAELASPRYLEQHENSFLIGLTIN